jgi:hypothetical protein
MNALTENISRLDRRIGGSPTLDAALGPLGDLVNGATWIGDATGWNLIVVPSPQDPRNPFLVMSCDFWKRYFGLITITESMWPYPSSSVAEFAGSFSPTPSTRNL